ncbi:hypothetical protein [Sphaerotilus sp.]|uniref:hypothetical protein n=1 Tax=Sphaerotilus sp. TaxID=2093942 RepID=UPI00286DA5D9|nr:hypothetical protein [Sphaerotilus sp.]
MSAIQTRMGIRKLPSPGELQACAARSLQLLQVIEATVTAVASDCEMLRLLTRDLAEVERSLMDCTPDVLLDPEARVASTLMVLEDIAERLHRRASSAYHAAVHDEGLHHDDGVADVWEDCVAAAADLHGAAQSLRERVVLLDRLKSPRSDAHESVDALFAAMGL